ncbi:MAG: putative manganese transporter, partial [Bacteroidales bacterium]|nr:putative manganese transporter [Bacteroidales bacterium]
NHVLKKHLLKIFLWIAGTLIAINLILHNFDVGTWIYDNMFFILIIALLLGIIPQSGPHLVFVVMFIQGLIPFSILLASSIVQDGHGALPLLAESKKSFAVMKFINILVGLLIGSLGLLLNF